MPTACWFSAALAEAESPSVEDGRGLVGVGRRRRRCRHGDRLGRRVGGARAVRGGDDDHVVLAAAVGGGRLPVSGMLLAL